MAEYPKISQDINIIKSLLPNSKLNEQLSQNFPIPKHLQLPDESLFQSNDKIHNLYPFVFLDTQPYNTDIIPPEVYHIEYRKRIPKNFNRINSYHRHYIPNNNKPWHLDQMTNNHNHNFQHLSSGIASNAETYPPIIKNNREKRYIYHQSGIKEKWADGTNLLTSPFIKMS